MTVEKWREEQLSGLLTFASGSRVDGGFAWLDSDGRPVAAEGLQLWINARMTYVFSRAHAAGRPGALDLAVHGVHSLLTTFSDADHGGWFTAMTTDGQVVDDTKSCYAHCFVLLAAGAARRAEVARADELLASALEVQERHFWDESAGRCREQWSRDWSAGEAYRGANSNMHAVEAYLAAAEATGDDRWLVRASEIVRQLGHVAARDNGWRVMEHFDEAWRPLPDYNIDRPGDPFRPYGATPGHGFEWARLVVELEGRLADPPAWMLEVAEGLFDRAASDTHEGTAGFCYTTDWTGRPVVEERFHWVQCEAIMAAEELARRTTDPRYGRLASDWWRFADEHFVDRDSGSWWHELDAHLAPASSVWSGKPDAYHLFNALSRGPGRSDRAGAGRPGSETPARSRRPPRSPA